MWVKRCNMEDRGIGSGDGDGDGDGGNASGGGAYMEEIRRESIARGTVGSGGRRAGDGDEGTECECDR